MELKDQQKINASPEKVYEALNDPEILQACIPGCDRLEKASDTEMSATITLKIGPVKAKFAGQVTLSNLNPPTGYTITGQGKAGPAGHAKGGADVTLQQEADGSTVLIYAVKADVGGKIAQLGSRLIDSTAKKLSAQFFEKFAELVETEQSGPEPETRPDTDQLSQETPSTEKKEPKSERKTTLLWGLSIAAAAAVILYFTR